VKAGNWKKRFVQRLVMPNRPILIVDDDAGERRIVQFWLEEEGYATVTANDGKSAIKQFEESSPCLIVSDIRMPQLGGMDLLAHIKAEEPDMPVILMTAYGTVGDAVEAMKLGAADYLLKPLNVDELKVVVHRALEHQKLLDENRYLREFAGKTFRFENLIGQSKKMRNVLELCSRVALRDSTVLLTGESGTGKELLAKAIHQNSQRADKPFVTVNCGALPENLAESELFGHRKGSFTGALTDRAGKFESANQGTVFLDEVAELPLNLQVKLLRVLQEHEIDKIGYPQPIKINVRILAATNRDLTKLVEDAALREDLYYRLSVIVIDVPPLRERREDIPLLIDHFLSRLAEQYSQPRLKLSDQVMEVMVRYGWPGNVRQLENQIERLATLASTDIISVEDLPAEVRATGSRVAKIHLALPDDGIDLEEVEKEILLQALEKSEWNQTRAAHYLNITRKTLIYRMEKFGLSRDGQTDTSSTDINS
jgi:two-component system, NtrC family, response regulator